MQGWSVLGQEFMLTCICTLNVYNIISSALLSDTSCTYRKDFKDYINIIPFWISKLKVRQFFALGMVFLVLDQFPKENINGLFNQLVYCQWCTQLIRIPHTDRSVSARSSIANVDPHCVLTSRSSCLTDNFVSLWIWAMISF